MNAAEPPPLLPPRAFAPSTDKTLRRLFLTLFLRGRSSRGLRKQTAPKSVGQKLLLALIFYGLFGLFALSFRGQPVFALSVYLHGLTFLFLGMFVASSAGEILFNKEEADILLHRPVTSRSLLWAKIRVLVEVSLWLAGALNLAGFFVGTFAPDGGWSFPIAHALSTSLEALFCAGSVVLGYQLCLRWFGREKLDGLMTTVQVVFSVTVVLAGQIVPRLIGRLGPGLQFNTHAWWIALLPPAWFAGVDDALAGQSTAGSWALAGFGVAATAVVLWLAFGKLAKDYEAGLQALGETGSVRKRSPTQGRRWLEILVTNPPLSWWLRHPVSRASFLLTTAYLIRDRDTKLRLYPGLAPVLVMPFIFLLQGGNQHGGADSFLLAFSGSYLGLTPLMGLNLLQYSQQWQAADVFRAAPMAGPAQLCHGARRAVLLILTLPLLLVLALAGWFLGRQSSQLLLFLPGLIALPVYALVPHLGGRSVPLSSPTEEAKSARRGLTILAVMPVSLALAGAATWSWSHDWFGWFLLGEAVLVLALYFGLRMTLAKARWSSME